MQRVRQPSASGNCCAARRSLARSIKEALLCIKGAASAPLRLSRSRHRNLRRALACTDRHVHTVASGWMRRNDRAALGQKNRSTHAMPVPVVSSSPGGFCPRTRNGRGQVVPDCFLPKMLEMASVMHRGPVGMAPKLHLPLRLGACFYCTWQCRNSHARGRLSLG